MTRHRGVLCLILLMAPLATGAFSIARPIPRARSFAPDASHGQRSRYTAAASTCVPSKARFMSSSTDDANNDKRRTALTKFVKILWRGISLPFPALREFGRGAEEAGAANIIGFTIRECVTAIFSYLSLGVLAYSVIFERWSIIDALYFSVTTFTTVGYGDLHPSTLIGRIFTCFFGFGGVAFLGIAVATIGSSLVQAEVNAIQAAERASRRRVMGMFEGMPSTLKGIRSKHGHTTKYSAKDQKKDPCNVIDVLQEKPMDEPTVAAWRISVRETMRKLIPSFTFLFMGGALMGRLEGWKLGDALYYSVITAGTLGYGDFSPATMWGRLWGILFIPLSVAAAGDVLGNFAATLVERRQNKVYKFLMSREVTMEHLLAMDTDKDGHVSRNEYVEFMLLEMQLVDKAQLDELHAQFDRLDVTRSGYLDQDDLRIMAKLRGAKGAQQGGLDDGRRDELTRRNLNDPI